MGDWKRGKPSRDPRGGSRSSSSQTGAGSRSAWQGKAKSGDPSNQVRRLWLMRMFSAAVFCGIAGVIYLIIISSRNLTPFVNVSIEAYANDSDNVLPPRPGGGLSLSQIKAPKLYKVGRNDPAESLKDQFSKLAVSINPGGPERNVVLVSLFAQGVVNGKGEPCLLDVKSQPFDEGSWIPVSDAITQLKESIKVKSGTRLVVFLDSGTSDPDWAMGIIQDEFSAALKRKLDSNRILPEYWQLIHVRGTFDPSHYARTGRRVLFGDLLVQGLRGAADGRRPNAKSVRPDDIVSLEEICAFIEQEAGVPPEVFSGGGRNSDNLASLYLTWSDLPSSGSSTGKLSQSVVIEKTDKIVKEVHESLDDGWRERHRLDDNSPWRHSPGDWSRFEWQLLRAERAYLALDQQLAEKCIKKAKILQKRFETSAAVLAAPRLPEPSVGWESFQKKLSDQGAVIRVEGFPPPSGTSSTECLAYLLNRDVQSKEYLSATGASNAAIPISEVIRLRQLAETASVPFSVSAPVNYRGEAVIRQLCDQVDEQRRSVEDFAFIGGASIWERLLRADIPTVRNGYDGANKSAIAYAGLMDQRDKLFAKLPWLFLWANGTGSTEDQKKLIELWNSAVDAGSYFSNPDDATKEDLGRVWKSVSSKFEDLNRLSDTAESLTHTDPNNLPQWIRNTTSLLSTPLVAGKSRNELRSKLIERLKIDKQPDAAAALNEVHEPGNEGIFSRSLKFHPLYVMFNSLPENSGEVDEGKGILKQFPNLELEHKEEPADKGWNKFAETVRARYLGIAQLDIWENALKAKPVNRERLSHHYGSLLRHDFKGRALAMLLGAAADIQGERIESVIKRLDQLQIQIYHDWQAERALRDYYGPPSVAGSSPYYESLAKYWTNLRAELDTGKFFVSAFADRIPASTAKVGSDTGLLSMELDKPKLEFIGVAPEPQSVVIKLLPQADRKPLASLGKWPSGMVAVEKPTDATSGKPFNAENRERIENAVTLARDTSGEWSRASQIGPMNGEIPYRAFFRGHRSKDASLQVTHKIPKPPEEREIWEPSPTPPDAKVLVKGKEKQRLWLMVVLDCSRSMNEDTKLKTKEGGSDSRRFDVARETLKSMLDELLDNEANPDAEYHVGLMAYGYRVGVDTDKDDYPTGKLLFDEPSGPDSPGYRTVTSQNGTVLGLALPEDRDTYQLDRKDLSLLDPSEDVGILEPIRDRLKSSKASEDPPFNRAKCTRLKNLIDRRSALGVTPLFLSIKRAAEHMEQLLDPNAKKMILVITDGADNQSTYDIKFTDQGRRKAGLLGAEKRKPTGLDDAIEAVKKVKNIQVRVVGLDLDNQSREERDRIDKLKRFCSTDGFKGWKDEDVPKLWEPTTSKQLTDHIRVALPPVRFRVYPADAEEPQRRRNAFGNYVSIVHPNGGLYVVDVIRGDDTAIGETLARTDPFKIHDGDSFELGYKSIGDKRVLSFHRLWDDLVDQPGKETGESIPPILPMRCSLMNSKDDLKVFRVGKRGEREWQAALLPVKKTLDRDTKQVTYQFQIGFRPANETDSPERPTIVRAVVTPIDPSGEVVCPYIYEHDDIQFSNEIAVPTLNLFASRWNTKWTKARVTLWFYGPGITNQNALKQMLMPLEILKNLERQGGQIREQVFAKDRALEVKVENVFSANGSTEITVVQHWKTDDFPEIDNIPLLRTDPRATRIVEKIETGPQKITYVFKFRSEVDSLPEIHLITRDFTSLPKAKDAVRPEEELLVREWREVGTTE